MDVSREEFEQLVKMVDEIHKDTQEFSELYRELVTGNKMLKRPGKILNFEQRLYDLEQKAEPQPCQFPAKDVEMLKSLVNFMRSWKWTVTAIVLCSSLIYTVMQIIEKILLRS